MHGSIIGLLTVIAAGFPSCVAAWFGYKNGRQLKTDNDKTVGQMLSEVHGKESVQNTDFETHQGPA